MACFDDQLGQGHDKSCYMPIRHVQPLCIPLQTVLEIMAVTDQFVG